MATTRNSRRTQSVYGEGINMRTPREITTVTTTDGSEIENNNTITNEHDNDNISSEPKSTMKRQKVKEETREDSLKLLKYSNMCLFKSLKTKFQCYTCKEKFIDITKLREHSAAHIQSDHTRKKNLAGHMYKNVDISSLKCNLCSQSCNNLKDLKQHLETKHKIKFSSTYNMFVPYKLEDGFTCVECGVDFNTFVPLSTHMNTHSKNNVCEKCGVFFINRLSLRTHIRSMHNVKKCSLCNESFDKNYAKNKHMKAIHNIGSIKRYCVLCDEIFRHSYLLVEHRIRKHGVARPISNCTECGKTFLTAQNLKTHVRSVHKRERNFQCDECGMTFFTRRDSARHKGKHENVQMFTCTRCGNKFKSKDSMRRHVRRLHGIKC